MTEVVHGHLLQQILGNWPSLPCTASKGDPRKFLAPSTATSKMHMGKKRRLVHYHLQDCWGSAKPGQHGQAMYRLSGDRANEEMNLHTSRVIVEPLVAPGKEDIHSLVESSAPRGDLSREP